MKRLIICPTCGILVQEYHAGLCSWCWWLHVHGYRNGHDYCKATFPEWMPEKRYRGE